MSETGLHSLVSGLRDSLLSDDKVNRQAALQAMAEYIESHVESSDAQSLNYLLEFSLQRIQEEDCLKESSGVVKAILGSSKIDRQDTIGVLISAIHDRPPIESRLAIIDILQESGYNIIAFLDAVKGEKDPRCLYAIFKAVVKFGKDAGNSVLDQEIVEAVFEAFCAYFPITFKTRHGNSIGEEELRAGLRDVLSVHQSMAHLSLPFLNEKLASSLSSSVLKETVKALEQCSSNASAEAISAYYKESTNLLISLFDKIEDSDRALHEATIDALAGMYCDSAIYRDFLQLICEHIGHSLRNRNGSKLYGQLPSLIRFVASPKAIASEAISSVLIEYMSQKTVCDIDYVEWSCLLGLLCAVSESSYDIFEAHGEHLKPLVKFQLEILRNVRCGRKSLVFAQSFIEAILRNAEAFRDEGLRIELAVTMFDTIEHYHNALDKPFTKMLVLSVTRHQRATLIKHTEKLAKYSCSVLATAFMEDDILALHMLRESVLTDSPNLELLLRHCTMLSSIDPLERVDWILRLDRAECRPEVCLDILICSLDDHQKSGLEGMVSLTTLKLIALSLSPEYSSVNLLLPFKDDPEVAAALFNKHHVLVDTENLPDRSLFCLVRSMILLQDQAAFEHMDNVIEKDRLLDDNFTRVNAGHKFIIEPSFEQWFIERAINRLGNLFSVDDIVKLLACCSSTTLQALSNIAHILESFLDGRPATDATIRLVDKLLSSDPQLLKGHYKQLIDSLISAAVTGERATTRLAALQCLQSILDIISGSAVLPFIKTLVRQLRPALGDKKAAVRAAAVRCTDLLYSFYVE